MREALGNLNADCVAQYPDYVCRVTADEGDIGRGHLSRFQDVETKTPVILTTSQLLTTGVDAPTCKNVVLARVVGSMSEFKQIIGRGTRVRDDYGKLWFNIIDYTGSATRLFADPDFDGEPVRITEEEITFRGRRPQRSPRHTSEPEEPSRGGPRSSSRRAKSAENSITMAARSKWPRISSTSLTPMASSSVSFAIPTMRLKLCALCVRRRRNCAHGGPILNSAMK